MGPSLSVGPEGSSGKVAQFGGTQLASDSPSLEVDKEVLRRPLQQVQALRVKRPAHLRHAPTLEETRALLQTVQDRAGYPTRLLTRLLYGCGLRVSEPLNLRVKDLDLQRGTIIIRGAKGGKDRVVAVPAAVKSELVWGFSTGCYRLDTSLRLDQLPGSIQ